MVTRNFFLPSGGSSGHQSRSSPSSGGGSGSRRALARNQSVSSQSSLEGAAGPQVHRGSSPQIRAFGPDGRHHCHDSTEGAAFSYPPSKTSRFVDIPIDSMYFYYNFFFFLLTFIVSPTDRRRPRERLRWTLAA